VQGVYVKRATIEEEAAKAAAAAAAAAAGALSNGNTSKLDESVSNGADAGTLLATPAKAVGAAGAVAGKRDESLLAQRGRTELADEVSFDNVPIVSPNGDELVRVRMAVLVWLCVMVCAMQVRAMTFRVGTGDHLLIAGASTCLQSALFVLTHDDKVLTDAASRHCFEYSAVCGRCMAAWCASRYAAIVCWCGARCDTRSYGRRMRTCSTYRNNHVRVDASYICVCARTHDARQT
jgi:hypothetical protein